MRYETAIAIAPTSTVDEARRPDPFLVTVADADAAEPDAEAALSGIEAVADEELEDDDEPEEEAS